MQKFRAFSLAETLTALGIIGVLCVTMLSLNSMSDNKYKVATTKLSQVDSAMKSWGKAVSQSNETGLGAAAIIDSQKALNDSLLSYFESTDNADGNGLTTSKNDSYGSSSNEITLNNGAKITFAYNDKGGMVSDKYVREAGSSPLAVITATISDLPEVKEEYIVKSDGLHDLDSLYDGYQEVPVETVTTIDENGNEITRDIYCANPKLCGNEGDCAKNPSLCINAPADSGKTLYVETTGVQPSSCGNNQTGTISTVKVADAYGIYTTTMNTCCPAPKVCQGAECGAENIANCKCDNTKFTPQAGYVYAKTDTCERIADKGMYAAGGTEELCSAGHFCPNDGMTNPIICPKGSYCPNYSDNKNKGKNNNYHPSVFADKNNILTGGLINKIECPTGYYCPDEGMTSAIKCPKGTYCPNKGMTEPIKCPAGTYGDAAGKATKEEACKPCPATYYCPNEGMTDNDKGKDTNSYKNFVCAASDGKFSAAGATTCSVCSAGQYLDQKEVKCKPCAKGHYSDKAGATACALCPVGTIQTEEGKSFCTTCSTGKSTDNRLLCGCVKGRYLDLTTEACVPCPVGTYADEPGLINQCKTCPNNASTAATGSTSIGQCKCIAGYSLYSVNNTGAKTEAGSSNGQEVLFTVDNKNKLQCMQTNCAYYSGANDNRQYYCGDYLKNNGSIPANISSSNIKDFVYGSSISGSATSCKARTSTQRFTDSNPVNHCGAKACDAHATLSENEFIIGENSTTPRKYTKCLCNKGYYGNGDTCTACPANSTTDGPGATSRSACKCIAGYSGNATTGACTACPANRYKTGVGNASCSNCPDNSATNNQTGRTSIAQCKCNAGYAIYDGEFTYKGGNFTEENKNTVSCQLTNCAYYSPANDNTRHYCVNYIEGRTDEKNIPKTTTMFNLGSIKLGSDFINRHKDEEVRDFVYGIKGQATGVAAKCGYRADNQRFTDSNPDNHCAVKTCNANATISADAFKISNGAKSTERKYTKCICKAGYYGDGDTCTKCPVGTYSEAGAAACTACPKGSYNDKQGQPSCTPCPCGTYQNEKGKTTCKKVPEGKYYAGEGLIDPTNAPNCAVISHAKVSQYCPAGRCSQPDMGSCPDYGTIYMLTDGHGHWWETFDSLLNTFTCIDRKNSTFTKAQLSLGGGYRMYIVQKKNGVYSLIATDDYKTDINVMRTSNNYNLVFGSYSYSAKGATYGNTCGSAHGSSANGGTLKYTLPSGLECEYAVQFLGKKVSPLILDLEGNGKNLTGLDDGVEFDLDADGKAEKTAWTTVQYTFDDAFLCLDRNANGLIDDGSELFGDQNGAANGFDELAKFDQNGDGKLNAKDEAYSQVKLWVDFNKNGVVDYMTNEDYKLFDKQTNHGKNLSKNKNMECEKGVCKYFVNVKEKVCEKTDNSFLPVTCKTNKYRREVITSSPNEGKTLELQSLDEHNISSLSTEYEEMKDENGNLLLDKHGNIIGMEGSFTQRVRVAAENAVDAMGNLLDGIVESAGNFFRSVVKSMTDVWFVTDNQ